MTSVVSRSVSVDNHCFSKSELQSSIFLNRNRKMFSVRFSVSASSSSQTLQFPKMVTQKSEKTVRVGVLGASGYTGSERNMVRLQALNAPIDGHSETQIPNESPNI